MVNLNFSKLASTLLNLHGWFFFFFFFLICYNIASVFMFWSFVVVVHKACGILAPLPGIKPGVPSALERKVLTTGPPGKSLRCGSDLAFERVYIGSGSNGLFLDRTSCINYIYFSKNIWWLWYTGICICSFDLLLCLDFKSSHWPFFIFYFFYYSGYGSSTFSMDRDHSSRTSAKALYGMFVYLRGINMFLTTFAKDMFKATVWTYGLFILLGMK